MLSQQIYEKELCCYKINSKFCIFTLIKKKMTTFRSRILQCPYCKTNMDTFELTSFTVHNSMAYSDGKVENNHSSLSDKQILICHECHKPMWREDVLLEQNETNHEDLPEAKDVFDLPFAFDSDFSNKLALYYSDLLKNGFANTSEKEIYLRIKIWHLLNNNFRSARLESAINKMKDKFNEIIDNNVSHKVSEAEANTPKILFINNLNCLTKIYKPDCDEQQLLFAEMFRELGNFNEAKLQLNKIKHIDNRNAYEQIAKLIDHKKSKVIKIT